MRNLTLRYGVTQFTYWAAAGTLILFCTVQKPEKSTEEARDADPAAAP